MRKSTNQSVFSIENLESRQLMSAAVHPVVSAINMQPMVISQSAIKGGTELLISGNTGDDQIIITESGNTYNITDGLWSTTITGTFKDIKVVGNGGNDSISLDASVTTNAILYGGAGNDTINSGSGNDRIYAGGGANVIKCGSGTDTVVTIGATADSITGGSGFDSFWINAANETLTNVTAKETAAGSVHKVSGFLGYKTAAGAVTPPTSLLGQNLVDPAAGASMKSQNFSTVPLFSDSGPAADDIVQGQVGDCYFLSVLSSVAKINANRIQQSVVDLGDGTYAVQFSKYNGAKVFVRVDADLAVSYGSTPAYAGVSKGLWVAVMEKAFAEFRTGTAAYAQIANGWMDESYAALGCNSTNLWYASNGNDLLNKLSAALAKGQSATLATWTSPTGSNLVANHSYTVDHVYTDAKGNLQLVLRNPWGIDGNSCNDGANDGYVTVTAAQAFAAFSGATIGVV